MRRLLLIGWLMLLPLGGLYHLVAGPHHREMDVIGDSLAEARRLVGEEDWHKAVPKFELALQNLPEELLRCLPPVEPRCKAVAEPAQASAPTPPHSTLGLC